MVEPVERWAEWEGIHLLLMRQIVIIGGVAAAGVFQSDKQGSRGTGKEDTNRRSCVRLGS